MLKAGQRFKHDNKIYRVLYVNACRAHCKCETRERVTVREFDRKTGDEREHTFLSGGGTINIAPSSFVELLGETESVAPVAPKPAPVALLDKGWYHLENVEGKVRQGTRMAAVLAHIEMHPGVTNETLLDALGKGADQIVQDLKRKGLVERR